jgi:hypothetical protein
MAEKYTERKVVLAPEEEAGISHCLGGSLQQKFLHNWAVARLDEAKLRLEKAEDMNAVLWAQSTIQTLRNFLSTLHEHDNQSVRQFYEHHCR